MDITGKFLFFSKWHTAFLKLRINKLQRKCKNLHIFDVCASFVAETFLTRKCI